MISIVIPVKNGAKTLGRCLEAINCQQVSEEVEVLVVDSGSIDRSQSLARLFGAALHEISPREFNHGATRNLGVRLTKGEVVVFTVQDALPIGTDWLQELIQPLREGDSVVGCYSRQVAQPSAPPHQRFYVEDRYGPAPRLQRITEAQTPDLRTLLFSNVSSAIRRPTLQEFPFAEDIVTAEDLEWSRRVLLAGHGIAYVPTSVVSHSHDYRLIDAFGRYFDQGAAADRTFLASNNSSGSMTGEGVAFVRRELGWLWRTGHRGAIPYAVSHEVTRFGAFQLGVHHKLIPRRLRAKFSNTPLYWEGKDS